MLNCPCCGLPKREQYCPPCIREGVALYGQGAAQVKAEVEQAKARAQALIDGQPGVPGGNRWRELRAQVAAAEQRVEVLRAQLSANKDEMKRARDTVARSDVRVRQETLEAAHRGRLSAADLRAQIAMVRAQHREVGKRIIQARRVLVREVVDVFGVQRGGKANGWEIAGIELPPPESFRLHPSMSINGAFMHTIHLLGLLTRYLSIAIPFEPTPPPPHELPHVGRPLIKANVPFLSTSKWREKHVLWMSSSAPVAGLFKKSSTNTAARQAAVNAVLAKSYRKHRATLTAFALLAHSVAYLAYTQGVPGIGLRDGNSRGDSEEDDDGAQQGGGAGGGIGALPTASGVLTRPTAVLELIAAMVESGTLGCRAHEPGTSDMLRHMGFGLDVKKVVAAVLASEDARWGVRPGSESKEELSEGWDLFEV